MPGYKATVIGDNFEFEIDDEMQTLEFSGTVYVEAEDDALAHESALAVVREALLSQALLDESSEQNITVDEIQQVDVLTTMGLDGDFIWSFPDEEFEE